MKRQETKICVICHRPMTWRRKWAKNWDDVKYCSDACRRKKSTIVQNPTRAGGADGTPGSRRREI